MSIVVPQPKMKPAPPAMEVQNLSHWIAREVPPNLLVLSTVIEDIILI